MTPNPRPWCRARVRSTKRRTLLQALRYIALCHGATLLCVSQKDKSLLNHVRARSCGPEPLPSLLYASTRLSASTQVPSSTAEGVMRGLVCPPPPRLLCPLSLSWFRSSATS